MTFEHWLAGVFCLSTAFSVLAEDFSGVRTITPSQIEFFEQHIRPVLVNECYECHGAKKQKGGLRLDSREALLKGGDSGPGLIPGDSKHSLLIQAIRHENPDSKMPKERPKLADHVITDLVTWVNSGAPDPRDKPAAELAHADTAWQQKVDARKNWWSFKPVQNPAVPEVKNCKTSDNAIDRFLSAKLQKHRLSFSPPADKRTLIRRATFDLTGLPPTPEELEAFEKDHSPNAFPKVVERLLNSLHYGEHWGRHWLDIVRYADTAGDTADYPVGLAWRYRNYVIDSFNSDKPYDEFLQEQIAGDILAGKGPRERYAERVTATGFLALSRRFGFDSEKYHHLTIQDTIDTLGQTVLGLSLGCARCHDHKFDPVSMKDYYALYGIFASSRYAFPGSEQKGKLRAMAPLVPPEESQPKWREYDRRVAALSGRIARQKQPVPAAVFRSLHDPDGDFEIQKDAAGGSYGVIVPPWFGEGNISVTTSAQSPFKNLYPSGKFGINIAGGDKEYWLEQTLHPRRTHENSRMVYLNLDFRPGPFDGPKGIHRVCIGSRNSPALELLISTEALFVRARQGRDQLAGLNSHEWHNLQLVLDLEHRTFSGSVGRPENLITFSNKPFASEWSGRIDFFSLDSRARNSEPLPNLEIDNFGLQSNPLELVSTNAPVLPLDASEPDPQALEVELQKLTGMDGDLEWQTEDSPPAKPWNPGPNSVVKISSAAQSPYRNIYSEGKMGVKLPSRGEYDGFGLTLSAPWKAERNEVLHAAFDFRCGDQKETAEGSWRYYLGHGGGGAAAIELHFTASELFCRSGDSHESVAHLEPGQWHQVQLDLNLKEKLFAGTVATASGKTRFTGTFATGWDGTIDYTFIDSHGHRPGVRPTLQADNFAFSATPFPSLNSGPIVETETERESRRARVTRIRDQLNSLGASVAKYTTELTKLLEQGPCDTAYGVVEGTPHNEHLQLRGEPDRPGDEVPRGFIKFLGGNPLPDATEGSGRLELARWLTRPENPLTARVMVNRIWQYHFGHGLVRTANDFGLRGQAPSHPELLDYLATQFVQNGWSIKAIHRLIMLSAAYQQSGQYSEAKNPAEAVVGLPINSDPANAAYSFFERRRLSAEELRDAILFVTGKLDETSGAGHPFPSPVTASYTQHAPFSAVYDNNQRSVYLMTQRIKRHPFLALFDGPDPNATTAERRITTVPTQALFFLNSPFVHEKAADCAARLRALRGDDNGRIELAWHLAVGRGPSKSELSEAVEFFKEYRNQLVSAGHIDPEPAVLAAYVRTLFASNEFLHVD